ncbi:PASTA domain-containing protein [Frankia sp. CcWB2]
MSYYDDQRHHSYHDGRSQGYQQPHPGGDGPTRGYGPPMPPPRQGRDWKKIGIIGGVAVVALLIVAAIASPSSTTATPTAATTAVPAATTTAITVPGTEGGIPTTAAPAATQPTVPAVKAVPNVVGMNLQSAQELLFPPLRSTSIDATGRGRLQIIDSHWKVVRQEPAAGTVVPYLTDIKLYVVKIDGSLT